MQHGAAGVLGVLVQAWRSTGNNVLRSPVARTTAWLAEAARRLPHGPVGLHFGSAGIAWALADAGIALGERALVEQATALLLSLPVDHPGPDLTHGRAGLGLTLLHLFDQAGPAPADRRHELLHRAHAVADTLVHDVVRDEHGVSWRTPPGTPSTFAGLRFHGFAHGTAGIGLFLLELAARTDRADAAALAAEAVDALLRAVVRTEGPAGWPSSPDEPGRPTTYWCNGSSGAGTFLARALPVLQDQRLPALLHAAAAAVMTHRWSLGGAYCHGLAGNADFVLDLAGMVAGVEQDWVRELASALVDCAVRLPGAHGVIGFSDEPGRVVPDFGVGTAGALSFLLRLRHGGPRLWLPQVAR